VPPKAASVDGEHASQPSRRNRRSMTPRTSRCSRIRRFSGGLFIVKIIYSQPQAHVMQMFGRLGNVKRRMINT
jgi:hypothetical protein